MKTEEFGHWLFCSRSNRQTNVFSLVNLNKIWLDPTQFFGKKCICCTCSSLVTAMCIYLNIENNAKKKLNGHNRQCKKKTVQTNRVSVWWVFCMFIYFSVVAEKREPFTIPLGGKCFRLVYFACLVFCCRFVNKNVHSSATTIFSVIDRHYSQHLVFVSFIVFLFFSRVECPNKSGCRKREWFFFYLIGFVSILWNANSFYKIWST